MAIRPRYLSDFTLVTSNCNVPSSSPTGAGTVARMASKSGRMSTISPSSEVAALPSRATA